MNSLEEALVSAFIEPTKRARYRQLLANPLRRKKLLDTLNHNADIDPRYATEVDAGAELLSLLRTRGAPHMCHLISDISELDGRELPLEEALAQITAGSWGTLFGCVPGRLACWIGECGRPVLLMERATPHAD